MSMFRAGCAAVAVLAVIAGFAPATSNAESSGAANAGGVLFVETPAVKSLACLPHCKGHTFPIAGRHDFGGAGAGFGSGRSGHSHQGHDVFARCGTPMVAARGGLVQARTYHAAAGHYVVIDADGSGTDYAYMHLAERSPLRRGDRVVTGQRIGAVGDSGNARGCHLHFELWSAPGYYEGGHPFDPLPALKAWEG